MSINCLRIKHIKNVQIVTDRILKDFRDNIRYCISLITEIKLSSVTGKVIRIFNFDHKPNARAINEHLFIFTDDIMVRYLRSINNKFDLNTMNILIIACLSIVLKYHYGNDGCRTCIPVFLAISFKRKAIDIVRKEIEVLNRVNHIAVRFELEDEYLGCV